jgi:hypothetical protein
MIYKLQVTTDKFIEKIYQQAMSELNEFFGINWIQSCPNIYLIKNRSTIDALWSRKTESFAIGWLNRTGDLCILDYKNLNKESSHVFRKERYFTTIKHELTHAFYDKITSNTYKPTWFREGIACYLSGENESISKTINFSNFLNYSDFYNKQTYRQNYIESGFAIEFLVKKYGKEKLLKLIKSIKKDMPEPDFAKLFKKIYGIPLEYKSFNI